MTEPTCKTCPHYHAVACECRFNPPVTGEKKWPYTGSDDWCSKHPDRVIAISLAMGQATSKLQQQQQRTPIVIPKIRP